jgi:hypothetical protein|tara:strand:+ start:1834 stop:2136 length:303 start_codon:yes stop_codon:yes gene_type:complete
MIDLTNWENVQGVVVSYRDEKRFLGVRVDDPERRELVLFFGRQDASETQNIEMQFDTGVVIGRESVLNFAYALNCLAVEMAVDDGPPWENYRNELNGHEE